MSKVCIIKGNDELLTILNQAKDVIEKELIDNDEELDRLDKILYKMLLEAYKVTIIDILYKKAK